LLQAAALAQQLEHDDVLMEVALGFTPFFLGGHLGGESEVRPVIRAALDRVGLARTPLRARLLAQLAVTFNTGDEWRDRRDLALQALEIGREVGDDGTLFDVIELCHQSLATPDRRDEHIRDVERAVVVADRAGDPIHRLRIRSSLMWVRYQQADAEGADATLGEMETLTDTLGLRGWRFRTAGIVTGRLLVAGRVSEAEAANAQVLALEIAAGVPEAEALATFGGLLFAIRQHQGRLNEIADPFVQAADDRPELPALRSAVAILLCELGRLDEARAKLAAAADFDYPYDSLWIAALTNVADAAVDVHNAPVAATLLERLSPFVNHVVAPDGMIAFGAVARPPARACRQPPRQL